MKIRINYYVTFVGHLCILFIMSLRLFIAALGPPVGKADLLAFVGDVYCIFVTFPCGILGQMWYLIVSFPDLCRLSYYGYVFVLCFLHTQN